MMPASGRTLDTDGNRMKCKDRIDIAFVGDLNLGGEIRPLLTRHSAGFPWALLGEAFEDVDIVIANLECCVVPDEMIGTAQNPKMTAVEPHLEVLAMANTSVVSLANNHIMDAGTLGLSTAICGLNRFGVQFAGAGFTLSEACSALEFDVHGRHLCLFAACDQSAYWARKRHPGVAPLQWSALERRIRASQWRSDIVIAMIHADYEFSPTPSLCRIKRSRRLISAGADFVIQHHPHVCQGIESYRGGLIAYSLGNFLFRIAGNAYQEKREGTQDSFILRVRVNFREMAGNNVEWWIIPVALTKEGRPALAVGSEGQRIRQEVQKRSNFLKSRVVLRENWFAVCRYEILQLYYSLAHALKSKNWRTIVLLLKNMALLDEKRRVLWGWFSRGHM